MCECKSCKSKNIVKNWIVRWVQRYKCKNCKKTFVEWDRRVKECLKAKKALAVLIYSLWKASYWFLAKIFNVSPPLIYRWIKQEWLKLEEPVVSEWIKEIEFDEMWHFIGKKKEKNGLSKPWIVVQGELSHGLSVVVMLQHLENYTIK
jgi:transposase